MIQRKVKTIVKQSKDDFDQSVQEFLDSVTDKEMLKIYSTLMHDSSYKTTMFYFFCVYEE